jgi:protein translocase SecG subunit
MQTSAEGLGGAFGGSDTGDSVKHTRRGFEKILFNSTIVLAILFAVISFVIFIISK